MSWLLPPLEPTYQAALRDVRARGHEARLAAAQRLGRPEPTRDPRAAREGLLELLDDPHPRVRYVALLSLGEVGQAGDVEAVVAKLSDPDPLVAEMAAITLSELGGAHALQVLEQALDHARAEVRFQAVIGYAMLQPRATAELRRLLRDPDARVRANCVQALGEIADASTHDDLATMLADADAEVRYQAALALARLGAAGGLALLHEALRSRDRCLEAAQALDGLENEESTEPLAWLATSFLKPLAAKAAAARALIRRGDPRGVPALRGVLRAWRPDARSYAVEIVGEARVLELLPELLRLIERPRGADPEALATALEAFAPHHAQAREGLERLAARHRDIRAPAVRP